jgi:hypothetical protein
MNNEIKQVLILGAGASHPYNFPLGDELFRSIIKTYPSTAFQYKLKNIGQQQLYKTPYETQEYKDAKNFVDNLEGISGVSIDKFINLNRSFKEDGIKTIIIDILLKENTALYPGIDEIKGDWVCYLFTKMLAGLDSMSDIKEYFHSNISIITFNYDRMFENYLFNNLYKILKTNQISKAEVSKIIESIPIIHVYGKIGYLEWETSREESKVFSYGNVDDELYKKSSNVADMIQLIYDERKDNDSIKRAKELLIKSNRILFMGFGYYELNLRILGIPETLKDKKVFGTAYKSTPNEITHIKNILAGRNTINAGNINIIDCDCLQLLREHLLV